MSLKGEKRKTHLGTLLATKDERNKHSVNLGSAKGGFNGGRKWGRAGDPPQDRMKQISAEGGNKRAGRVERGGEKCQKTANTSGG